MKASFTTASDGRRLPIHKLSILVPCFNEAENISRYSSDLFPVFDQEDFSVEFIFINDGSSDATSARLKGLQLQDKRVKIVQHPTNQGLGASVKSGLRAAEGDAVLTLDADLTFSPQEALQLIETFQKENADCVAGSPLLGRMQGVSFLRRFLSSAVNSVYAALWPVPLSATSSIFRVYRADLLKSLDLHSNSFDINAEIMFKLFQREARIIEVPVVLGQRMFGKSNIKFSREIKNHLRMFLRIISWRFFPGIVKP